MPEEEAKTAIRDLGVKYQLVTDYTSMLVLADGDFTKRGIDRNNQQRIAIEHAAPAASAPHTATLGGTSHSLGHGGGGAFDPLSALLAVVLAASAIAIRKTL